uniref:2,4-dihydroxy-7-methoxy-2H-1,4-benzoxazin-3(4H)-one 2-D-glucosyltransferase n=1 Tax=Leersia perrieri TaxID=77586 RepID=A0A0D9WXM0_9ORYZ
MPSLERSPDAGAGRRRVVLFPLPYQGHLSPMFQLAALLRDRGGLAVTVLHTDFNAPDPARHPPDIAFVPIHESLAEEEQAAAAVDLHAHFLSLDAACVAPFRAAVASLREKAEDDGDVACVVLDSNWLAVLAAAAELGVPLLALRTVSAATSRNLLAFRRLCDDGYVVPVVNDERRDEPVPGLEPLRVGDLVRYDGWDVEKSCEFITKLSDAMRVPMSGVILNTFDAIEADELGKLQAELSVRAFAVGPLHKLSPETTTLRPPHRGCLAWLDAHPPRSVIYVSMGSVAKVSRKVFDEMAWGLSASGVPFLWVVRPGLVGGEDDATVVPQLPDGVDMSRGMVVPWAPQREVLAHPATGGFWTHCGWNSTLEGICEGVPMLAQPCFSDQTVNTRYVTHQWGVGMELVKVFDRVRVGEAVRELMVGEEGDRVRDNARRLRIQANQCVASTRAIDDLVEFVRSL